MRKMGSPRAYLRFIRMLLKQRVKHDGIAVLFQAMCQVDEELLLVHVHPLQFGPTGPIWATWQRLPRSPKRATETMRALMTDLLPP